MNNLNPKKGGILNGIINRCPWCLGFREYIEYHDDEWGKPSYDDNHLFEMLLLEGVQAGLSWSAILKKKDGFRFIGTTICYAYMQSIGMVNDHLTDCFRYREV